MFEIVGTEPPFRVSDNGTFAKARFHRREQAEAWIAERERKAVSAYENRKGHLHAGDTPSVYDENLLSYP